MDSAAPPREFREDMVALNVTTTQINGAQDSDAVIVAAGLTDTAFDVWYRMRDGEDCTVSTQCYVA